MDRTHSHPAIEPKLGLWDSVSIIVGIIIGVGIFQTPASIFDAVPNVWAGLGVWVLGGVFALLGRLFRRAGDNLPALGRRVRVPDARLRPPGRLPVRVGAAHHHPTGQHRCSCVRVRVLRRCPTRHARQRRLCIACASIAVLTTINVLGVVLGAWTQNLLTAAKVLGLVALVVVGLGWGTSANLADNPHPGAGAWIAGVMIAVLWAYSGWQEAAYVVAEIKDRRRNIPRASCGARRR